VGHDEKYYHYASVIFAEARGEGRAGQIAVLSSLRNGARGYKTGKITPELVELVVGEMKMPVTHSYRHFINFGLATDRKWVRWARRQDGVLIGRHFFF
jgi:hypothetical protein